MLSRLGRCAAGPPFGARQACVFGNVACAAGHAWLVAAHLDEVKGARVLDTKRFHLENERVQRHTHNLGHRKVVKVLVLAPRIEPEALGQPRNAMPATVRP